MRNQQSILNMQGKLLEENAHNLQATVINGHQEQQKSNHKTVKAVPDMQKSHMEELNQINNEISTSMTNIQRKLNETVKKAEQETRDLASNAKHGALVTNIIDALKYGAATSAITIPVLYFLLS